MSKKSDKDIQAELRESAHRIWLAGLGALSAAGEEGEKLFSRLVDKGQEVESKGKGRAAEAKTRVESAFGDVEKMVDEKVTQVLHRVGVPTRDEIHKLTRRVEELNAKIARMEVKKPAAKAKATTKPPKAAPVRTPASTVR